MLHAERGTEFALFKLYGIVTAYAPNVIRGFLFALVFLGAWMQDFALGY